MNVPTSTITTPTSRVIVSLLLFILALTALSQHVSATVSKAEKKKEDDESGPSTSIVGGEDAKPGEYPYYVLSHTDGNADCGGTLISPTLILTAAHCSKPFHIHGRGSKMKVGVNYRNTLDNGRGVKNGKMIEVKKAMNHKNYDKDTFNNDIALYLLKKKYKIKPNSPKVVLNRNLDVPEDGDVLTAIGMGLLYPPSQKVDLATTLQYVDLPFVKHDTCKIWNSGIDIYPDTMLCAGYEAGEKDTCSADSGGPLILKKEGSNEHVHVGVTSFGTGCASPKAPGVYARTGHYIDWIKQTACNKWKVKDLDLCCEDDDEFRYKNDKNKTCEWVKTRKEKWKKKICKMKETKRGCPCACGVCCADDL